MAFQLLEAFHIQYIGMCGIYSP